MANLKFPILKNVEYMDISKGKDTKFTLNKSDTQNKTWREIQLVVGTKLGVGVYRYSLKHVNEDKIYTGSIRAVKPNEEIKKEASQDFSALESKLVFLSHKIDNMETSGDPNSSLLIEVIKENHASHIMMLNEKISDKEKYILKLELRIDNQDKELTEQDSIIEELRKETGTAAYTKFIMDFLKEKMGKGALPLSDNKVESLSDPGDVPQEITRLLGVVDWSQVTDDMLKNIIQYLGIYIQKLPLKG